jgi:hypothetical protein
VDYPNWFTVLEREGINEARDQATARMVVVNLSIVYASDADARAAALAVLKVAADVLAPHRTRPDWTDARRRLRDALIVEIDRHRPNDTWPTLKAFAAAVEQALAVESWWPVDSASPPARRARQLFPNRAAWLKSLMRGRTPYMFHKQFGGPDAKTITKILHGHSVSDHVLARLVAALNDAGHRVTFQQIPRD